MAIVVPSAGSSAQAVGMTLPGHMRRPARSKVERHSLGATGEPFPEVGSQMAPKMGPQRKSGPVLISQHRP